METLLIFVPCALYNEEPGTLYGVVQESKEEYVKAYFIIGKIQGRNRHSGVEQCRIIGYYCKEDAPFSISLGHELDCVLLGLCDCEFILHEVLNGGDVVDMSKPCQTICIIYDHQKFILSELLLESTDHSGLMYGDHFKMLASKLSSEVSLRDSDVHTFSSLIFKRMVSQQIIKLLLCIINILMRCINYVHPVLKYTTLESHLQIFLQSLIWVLQSCSCKKNLSVKVGNYIVAVIVDICSGMLLLYWLSAITSSPSQLLLESGEVVVRTLRELLEWLMGIPAGLKLNYAFNNMLGQFFLYHINLWWTFLVVAKPLLEVTFYIFLCLGQLGLTFQASILADLLALVSLHIYCIYVYAARLYSLQVSGLVALWRLFLGQKRNPL